MRKRVSFTASGLEKKYLEGWMATNTELSRPAAIYSGYVAAGAMTVDAGGENPATLGVCDFFGVTIFLGHSHPLPKYELSSRERPTEDSTASVSVIERGRQAIFTRERRPGRGTLLAILLAISSEAVAAGEGALQTCRAL